MKKKKVSINSLKHAVKFIIFPRWKRVLIAIGVIIIGRVSSLVVPGASKYLIDEVFLKKDYVMLKWILVGSVAAVTIQAVSNYTLVRLLSVEAQYLISELRILVQKHVLKLPLSFYLKEKSGALVSRIMNDAEGVRNLIGTGLIQLFGSTLTSIMAFFILVRINKEMTFISLLVLVLFAVVMFKWFKKIRPIFRKRGEINAEVNGRLTETIGGIKVIKSFNAEVAEEKIFEKGAMKLFKNVRETLTATAWVSMLGMLMTGLISAMVMGISSYFVIEGEMTSGDFVAYLMYLALLAFPIVQFSNIGSQLSESFAGLDRMNEVLSLKTEYQDEKRVNHISKLKKNIVFKDIKFKYTDRWVLNNLNFELKKGEVVALVGTSGSGKSTIANLALSLMDANDGSILVDGVDLKTIDLKSYRNLVGVVLQDDFLFDGTIRENITYANTTVSDKDLEKVVKLAYVDQFTKDLDDGLDTVIGERGVKLSGGQKQRLSIARAILSNPQLLILDEATSSLDNESEMYIQKSLKSLFKSRTTLVIAHRLSTIEQADKILVVENGKVVESGKHQSLLRKKGRYHKLFTYQSKI